MRFWDSSALVPLVLEEPMTAVMEGILDDDREIVLWWGSIVECASALSRSLREKRIGRSIHESAIRALEELHARAFEIQPTREVRRRALRLLRLHHISAADSFQLSAALAWCGEKTDGAGFVCLDSRLRDAAMREGFEYLPDSP